MAKGSVAAIVLENREKLSGRIAKNKKDKLIVANAIAAFVKFPILSVISEAEHNFLYKDKIENCKEINLVKNNFLF
jgi:hypothetical protein